MNKAEEKLQHIPQLLDYRTLEEYYGLKKSTISKMVMLGTFCNVVRFNGKNHFRKEDVETFIDNNTVSV